MGCVQAPVLDSAPTDQWGNMGPFGLVALPFEAAGGVVGTVTAPINLR
jgi:hypothetical protein